MAARTKERGAEEFVPAGASLKTLAKAVEACRGCSLYEPATQAVFGEGPASAKLVLVGEQPGDREDRSGRPFVGPAGRMLDQALEAAGLDRERLYLTNAVKHFRFRFRGKRRLHDRPRAGEMRACAPWLGAELERVSPRVIVCLGASAARTLLGTSVKITADRGRLLDPREGGGYLEVHVEHALVTYHPSALLRAEERRDELFDVLVSDLRTAGEAAGLL